MKVAVYCEPLGVKTSGSPGRGMLKALIELRREDEFILIVRKNYNRSKELTDFLSELAIMPNWQLHIEPRSRKISNLLALFRIRNYGRLRIVADVFINTDCTALGTGNHPLIITVADLSVLKGRGTSSYKTWISFFLRKFLLWDGVRKADEIVAISNSTKKDITTFFPDKRNRINVVYNGISDEWLTSHAPAESKILNGLANYWVWWGHISTRKNLNNLVRGYFLLKQNKKLPNIVLIYSNLEFPSELSNLIEELRLTDHVILLKHLPTYELINVVEASKGLLFPSLIEGFGLPIVEAMSKGIPVLTSYASAMPEIAGEEAVLCDPNSIEDIACGLEKMLQPEMWSEVNTIRRKNRARLFTYKEAAKGYSRLIDKVCKTESGGNCN